MIIKTNELKEFKATKVGANYKITAIVKSAISGGIVALEDGVVYTLEQAIGDFCLTENGVIQISSYEDVALESLASYVASFIEELKGEVE